MIARLLISPSLEARVQEIDKLLSSHLSHSSSGSLNTNHPDVLYFRSDSKLGIEQARKIKEYFSLKPYSAKGRVVILEDASSLTIEAQNALLKTFEELPREALFILGTNSDTKFLPTILSRCQIFTLQPPRLQAKVKEDYITDVEKLLTLTLQERFEYIEKLKDRESFLHNLIKYFHQNLAFHPKGASSNIDFIKTLLQAEEWANQNVNIRAILEYLMLVMPSE